MKLRISFALGALAVLASQGAFAQLYKCQQDGRTTYQERPCGNGDETRMSGVTGWATQWVGCYEVLRGTAGAKRMRDLRVRGAAAALVLDVAESNEAFPIRRMTAHELQLMESGMAVVVGGARVLDGIAIAPRQEERVSRHDAVHGVYRFAYPDGREELRAALPFGVYLVQKARCKSS